MFRSMTIDPPVEGPLLTSQLLTAVVRQGASDLHLDPTADGYSVRLRIDGLLQPPSPLSISIGRAVVARLMAMAGLLTYRLDQPQEGRFQFVDGDRQLDCRLAIIPARNGVRAAVRLPTQGDAQLTLDGLQLSDTATAGLKQFAAADSGMLVLCGPAGAGKTTTIYALLQHLVSHHSQVSVIALEDPVERDLPGVTQIEVSDSGSMTYERALRSVLRQDPQVIMLGEIRDAAAASLALQAALSGHRLICTLHASSCGGAIGRLLEMQIEPYQITSCLWGVLSQRLVRRKAGDAYRGRVPLAEFVRMSPPLRSAILSRADVDALEAAAAGNPGYCSLRDAGRNLIQSGVTDEAELQRVLGPVAGANHE